MGAVHRPRLPVRARRARPGSSRPIPRPSGAPASTAWTRRSRRASWSAIFGWFLRRPPDQDQPLALAQFPDDPQRALGAAATSCCSATPSPRRISRSAPAPSSPWRTRSRSTRRCTPSAASMRRWRASRPARREEVEKTQHAADVSLVWFEHVDRFWDFDPVQFAFGVMTRAKAITYDNLRLRAPEFVDEVDRHFRAAGRGAWLRRRRRRSRRCRCSSPCACATWCLPNRVVVSPMDMYSAVDGVPEDWHLVHYGARAIGGAGAALHRDDLSSRRKRASPSAAPACGTTSRSGPGRRIVDFVHANSAAKFCLQLGHSGRKGATKLMWEGMDRPLDEGAWDVVLGLADPVLPGQPRCRANWTAPAWTASSPSSSPRPSVASAPAST